MHPARHTRRLFSLLPLDVCARWHYRSHARLFLLCELRWCAPLVSSEFVGRRNPQHWRATYSPSLVPHAPTQALHSTLHLYPITHIAVECRHERYATWVVVGGVCTSRCMHVIHSAMRCCKLQPATRQSMCRNTRSGVPRNCEPTPARASVRAPPCTSAIHEPARITRFES